MSQLEEDLAGSRQPGRGGSGAGLARAGSGALAAAAGISPGAEGQLLPPLGSGALASGQGGAAGATVGDVDDPGVSMVRVLSSQRDR